jgi:protein-S-isoprenylcysteine O-methyltransferase
MQWLDPRYIGPLFGLSEFALLLAKRAREGARAADSGSLSLIWVVILLCMALAALAGLYLPQADSGWLLRLRTTGGLLFLAGLLLRWYAIIYLGRFFTVNVAIAADHRVVDTGPYRWVRHPSYSGSLLEFLGFGITFGNWLSLALLTLPVAMVFHNRIRIEEQALCTALGDDYRRYMARTRRLIPGIY